MKDMELKVGDLERASNSANHENGLLRAQIERLQEELRDYRRRLSSTGNSLGSSPTKNAFSSHTPQNKTSRISTDFNFDFPKFGSLPGTHFPITSQSYDSSNMASDTDALGDSSNRSPRSGSNSMSSGTSELDNVLPTSESYSDVDQLGRLITPGFLNAIDNDKPATSGSAPSNNPSPCSSTLQTCPSLSYDTSPEPCQKSPDSHKPTNTFDSVGVYQGKIISMD